MVKDNLSNLSRMENAVKKRTNWAEMADDRNQMQAFMMTVMSL
jgi:hypothetical protein